MSRKRLALLSASAAAAIALGVASVSNSFGQSPQPQPYAAVQRPAYVPEFDAQGRLIRPTGWREWPYIGTPITPNGLNPPQSNFPEFHNVYIDPESWEYFKRTGEFRDGTVIVKELVLVQRNQTTDPNGSTQEPSGRGYFMAEYSGLETAIKDSRRFADQPGHWAYFTFGHVPEARYAAAAPVQAAGNCNACHAANAGRDFVFIQHYPVLRDAHP
jgi:hypothetical protein